MIHSALHRNIACDKTRTLNSLLGFKHYKPWVIILHKLLTCCKNLQTWSRRWTEVFILFRWFLLRWLWAFWNTSMHAYSAKDVSLIETPSTVKAKKPFLYKVSLSHCLATFTLFTFGPLPPFFSDYLPAQVSHWLYYLYKPLSILPLRHCKNFKRCVGKII